VDLYVDADMWLENVAYLDNSGYFNMDTDQHLYQVVPSNSLTPIDNLLTTLQDDDDYTYIALGSALDADALMLVDNNERPSNGAFKLRIIDAYQSTGSYNVYVLTSSQQRDSIAPTAKNLRYKSVTTYFTGRSGVYNVLITDSRTGEVVTTITNQTFNEEEVYTLILAANPSSLAPIYPLLLNDTEND
jgi:hypothetical protein